ncbi:DUF6368 family protein [Streptomyces griseochromogenes]|uniref:DUF6368 family protein n=1 Tax=Streptomyces griseochromogenes TaxID=68214 RepID=UPI0037AD1F0E
MGGPAAGLWLPREQSALDALPWLESFCEVRIESGDSLEFHVRDPAVLGLPRPRRDRSCAFSLGPESLEDYRELGFPGLGRWPAAELCLLAHCSGKDDHLLLGRLALSLAERFGALIDFGGLLGYRYSLYGVTDEERAVCLARSRGLVASLPGRVWEMPYATGDGVCGYSHVADREFLAAWLDHREFRMIK